MPEPGADPSLRGYLHVMRRSRWWIAACALAGLGIALALALTSARQYSATAQILVQSTTNVSSSAVSGSYSGVTSTDVQTELQLVTSAPVQALVVKDLGYAPAVSAAEVGQTNVIAITAVSATPGGAARVANAYARAFTAWSTAAASSNLAAAEAQLNAQVKSISKEIEQLPQSDAAQAAALSNQQAILKGQLAQLQVAGATASTGLELVTPATPPASPSSPKPLQDALLGLVAGLVAGLAVAFLRSSLDDTLSSGEGVERVLEAPVMATVPMVASWRKKARHPIVTVSDPTSQPAEAYRSLRTSLQFARQDQPLRTILVTSPGPGDGKTSTVVNLAAAFAQAGARVVVVSCDLRRPGLSEFFPPAGEAELSLVLRGDKPLEQALTAAPGLDGVWTVGTRTITTNPTELLSGPVMRRVIGQLADHFDIVLLDSPPVLPVADAMILAGQADATLVVVATGQTRRAELRRTRDKLAQAGAHVIGAVLNKATAQDGYGYYGGYAPYLPGPKHGGRPLPARPGQPEN